MNGSLMNTLKFNRRLQVIATASLLSLIGYQENARALSIDANLTNLADSIAGQDLWNASFSLSSGVFQADEGFTIYFNPLDYSDISAPLLPIPAGWDVLSIQPDPLLSAPGFLDGLALVNSPTLAQPFSVNFVWRGAGTQGRLPGAQPFETYRLTGGFAITGSGQTSVVPEIGNGATYGMALILACFLSATRRRAGGREYVTTDPAGGPQM